MHEVNVFIHTLSVLLNNYNEIRIPSYGIKFNTVFFRISIILTLYLIKNFTPYVISVGLFFQLFS